MIIFLSILGYLVIGIIAARLLFVLVMNKQYGHDEVMDNIMLSFHVLIWPAMLLIWTVVGIGWVIGKIITAPEDIIEAIGIIPSKFRSKK